MDVDINGLLTMEQREELTEAAASTFAATISDSNDDEIAALQNFRDLACQVLGIDTEQM